MCVCVGVGVCVREREREREKQRERNLCVTIHGAAFLSLLVSEIVVHHKRPEIQWEDR